jgi:hypothetical protein
MWINKTPDGLFPRMQLYLALVFWASSRVDPRQHCPSLAEKELSVKRSPQVELWGFVSSAGTILPQFHYAMWSY